MSEGHEIPCSWNIGLAFVNTEDSKDITREYADDALQLISNYKSTLERLSEQAINTGVSVLSNMVFWPLVAPSVVLAPFSHTIASVSVDADSLSAFSNLTVNDYSLANFINPSVTNISVSSFDTSSTNFHTISYGSFTSNISQPNAAEFDFNIEKPETPELTSKTFNVTAPQFLSFSLSQFEIPELHSVEELDASVDFSDVFESAVPDITDVVSYNHNLTNVIVMLQKYVEQDLAVELYSPIESQLEHIGFTESRYDFLEQLWDNRSVVKFYNKVKKIVTKDAFKSKYNDLFAHKVSSDRTLQIKYKIKAMLLDGWVDLAKFVGENTFEYTRLVYQREVLLAEGKAKLFEHFKSVLNAYVAQARIELAKYIGTLAESSAQRYQFIADVEAESAFAKYNKSIAALYAAKEKIKLVKVNEAKIHALQADALASIYKAQLQQQLVEVTKYKALVDEYKAKSNEYVAKISEHMIRVKQNALENDLVAMANQVKSVQSELNVAPALLDTLVTKQNVSRMLQQAENIKLNIKRDMTKYTATDVRNYSSIANYITSLMEKQKEYMIKALQYNVATQHYNLYNNYYSTLVQLANVVSDTYMQASNAYVSAQQQHFDTYQKYVYSSADVYATILSGKLSKYRIGATLNARGDVSYSLDKTHGTRDTITYSNSRSNECITQFESM